MNDPISWDPSLVKKFSSSNHHKLLNQLKNEVKKYPLNYKKKGSSIQGNDNNQDIKSRSNISHSQNSSSSYNSNHTKETSSTKSTVSFNNGKNFSIYNNNNNNRKNVSNLTDFSKSNDDSFIPSFKDRLNEIDMK